MVSIGNLMRLDDQAAFGLIATDTSLPEQIDR